MFSLTFFTLVCIAASAVLFTAACLSVSKIFDYVENLKYKSTQPIAGGIDVFIVIGCYTVITLLVFIAMFSLFVFVYLVINYLITFSVVLSKLVQAVTP